MSIIKIFGALLRLLQEHLLYRDGSNVASLYYYSTNPLVSYRITKKFFKNIFRVYAAEEFDTRSNWSSSNPKHFYDEYVRIADEGDIMDPSYDRLVQRLRSAADTKLNAGELTKTERTKLETILVSLPSQMYFMLPLVYIIEREKVDAEGKAVLQEYPDTQKDRRKEWLVSDLERNEFEIMSPAFSKPRPQIRNS